MSYYDIAWLTITEIVGDFGFKEFANKGGIRPFLIGTIGYIGVIYSLIVSLQGSTVLMVNAGWDGISALVESIAAYVFLGERLGDFHQYLGVIFIILGLFLLKMPLKRKENFKFPSFFKPFSATIN